MRSSEESSLHLGSRQVSALTVGLLKRRQGACLSLPFPTSRLLLLLLLTPRPRVRLAPAAFSFSFP